jgi:histidinol-phosphate aminotransferase
MKELRKELSIRTTLVEEEKISYASEEIFLPDGGIDCNEGCNPYGFPSELLDAMRNFDIKRFGPYPHSHAINDGLAEYWKGYSDIEPENILLADGSINALYTVFGIFNNPGAVVLGISPQFTDAEMTVKLLGMEYRSVKLRKENNYRFDTDEFISNITDDVNVIYIDNPNNPTGQMIGIYEIEKILGRAIEVGAAVIIDEAYGDFMPNQNSAMQLTEEYPNLIMVRTLSKAFGLAGLRVGYVIAPKTLISYMKKIVNPYQVSEFAREMAGEALKNPYHVWENIQDFAKMKRDIREVLKAPGHLKLAETYDTVSIFLLLHDDPSVDLQKLFWENKVLCVSGYSFDSLDKDSARIRLPKIDEFPVLLDAIKTIHQA